MLENIRGTTMHRDKLAKVILFTLILPLVVYFFGSCILNYIPPTESYKKTPKQFEELFNVDMAQYGMSIDVDSADYTYGDSLSKTVPIVCEDGSKVLCTYYPTGTSSRSIIQYMVFEQELSGKVNETVYLEQLLAFVMDEFAPKMTQDKDETFEPYFSETYNEALMTCQNFVTGKEKEVSIYVSPQNDHFFAVTFNRKTDEKTSLSVRFHLWRE